MNRAEAIGAEIRRLAQSRGRLIVAVDGRSGAGKTTLAAELLRLFPRSVAFHLDDFFLPPALRSAERLSQPGGNVHYERFLQEVLTPLKAGRTFSYRPFDCRSGSLLDPRPVVPSSLAIIEGSYSLHPKLSGFYDYKVFLTLSPQEQARRIKERNGPSAEYFFKKWIPLEEAYFSAFDIAATCDIVIDNTSENSDK